MSPCSYSTAKIFGEDGEIESWILSLLLSSSLLYGSTREPTFGQRTMAEEFPPFTPSASRNRGYLWKEDGEIDCASLGRNTTARFSASNILFSRMLLIYIRPQPVVSQKVLLVAIFVIHACLTDSRQSGQLTRSHPMPRDDIMADDDLLFLASSRFQTPQHGDITTHDASLNRTVPSFGTFNSPLRNGSPPRHHFRRGAICEASGQSIPSLVDG